MSFLGYTSSLMDGISHILENLVKSVYQRLFGISLEYSISQKNTNILCTLNYSYPEKMKNFHVPEIFWDIYRDIPYPVKLKISMYRNFFGISQGYPISRKNKNFQCTGIFLGYPIYQYFFKLCTAGA